MASNRTKLVEPITDPDDPRLIGANKNAHGRLKRPDPDFKFALPGSFRWWYYRHGLKVALTRKVRYPVFAKTGKKWKDFVYKHTTLRRLAKRDEEIAREDFDKVRNLDPITGKQQDHPWNWEEIQRDQEGHIVDVIQPRPALLTGPDPLAGPWGA